jgi:hypothetical protein
MKSISILFSLLFFTLACSNSTKNEVNTENNLDSNPIVRKWKLQKLQKISKKNEVNLQSQPTEVILSIMDGGYFVIYDTFVDPKFNFKGFNRIEERSKGQWVFDNKNLTLHHHSNDTSYTEELEVTLLNKNTLSTKSIGKKNKIFKTYKSY